MANIEPILLAISREKNIEKQRKYKNGLKEKGLRRISLVIKDETLNRIKALSEYSGCSQGEVINRLLENEGEKAMKLLEEDTNEIIKVDPFYFEEFSRRELAVDTMARMLGINFNETFSEEKKTFPNKQKLKELEQRRKILLSEQQKVYAGDEVLIQRVINEYCPKAYSEDTE